MTLGGMLSVMLSAASVVLPTLVSVVVMVLLRQVGLQLTLKPRLDGLRETTVPVPLRTTACGLPGALSATDNDPVRVLLCVGVKVTLMVQLAPAARLAPQLLEAAKSPDAVMLVMLRGARAS